MISCALLLYASNLHTEDRTRRETKNHATDRGLKVVGYYQAMEYVDANAASLGPVGERVVEKVKEGFSEALAIVVRGPRCIERAHELKADLRSYVD